MVVGEAGLVALNGGTVPVERLPGNGTVVPSWGEVSDGTEVVRALGRGTVVASAAEGGAGGVTGFGIWMVGRALESGAVVIALGAGREDIAEAVSVGDLTEMDGGADLGVSAATTGGGGGTDGFGAAGTGVGGGVAATAGGVTGAGGLGRAGAGVEGTAGGLTIAGALAIAGTGGGIAGGVAGFATAGAEVAIGNGAEGGLGGATSKGCVTAAWAPCPGRSTKRSEVVGRLIRTGAVVPSGKVGRPGAARIPELGASAALAVSSGLSREGCGGNGSGGRGAGARWLIEGAFAEAADPGGCSGSVFLTMEMACVEARAGAFVWCEMGSRPEEGASVFTKTLACVFVTVTRGGCTPVLPELVAGGGIGGADGRGAAASGCSVVLTPMRVDAEGAFCGKRGVVFA